MLDKASLSALEAVIATGSFDAAATRLRVTQSAVSQRIRALEHAIGSPVIIRDKPCKTTDIGARLIRHAQDVAIIEQATMHDIGAVFARSTIRIALNADSLATWVLPALAQLHQHLFDLTIDDQDCSAQWLRTGTVAAAITSRSEAVQGCDVIALGTLPYLATCSPSFRQRYFADGLTKENFEKAPSLTFNAKDDLQNQFVMRECGTRVALPCHHIASTQGFVTATRIGLGWGLNPISLVEQHLAEGTLVSLSTEPLTKPLYWQISRLIADPLAELTATIKAAARSALIEPIQLTILQKPA